MKRQYYVLIAVLAFVLSFFGSRFWAHQQQEKLERDNEMMQSIISDGLQEIEEHRTIERVIEELTGISSLDELTLEKREPTEAEMELFLELADHPELIPVEGSLGGTMRFWPEACRVIDEHYVLAYAEDGHVYVWLLLYYEPDEQGGHIWKLMAYALNNSEWRVPETE